MVAGFPAELGDILPLLRCPKTGQPLQVIDDPAIVATEASRHARKLDALLRSTDGRHSYAVVDGIPLLAPEPPNEAASAKLEAEFQKQMLTYSEMSDRWYGELNRNIQQHLRKHYYWRCAGSTVLDVGNGGTSAEQIFGPELGSQVTRFIGLDKSFPMLRRRVSRDVYLLGDALTIPMADQSVDYVLVNGVIHHLGLVRGGDPKVAIGRFVSESLRVSRKGLILFELLIPDYAFFVERLVLTALGTMATFVYSYRVLSSILRELGFRLEDSDVRRLTNFLPYNRWMPPVLTMEWLRVPAVAIPYSYLFAFIPKN